MPGHIKAPWRKQSGLGGQGPLCSTPHSAELLPAAPDTPDTPGPRLRSDIFQRRCMDDQQAHEKMLNITSHQGNANQNHNEVPPHTGQNGHH